MSEQKTKAAKAGPSPVVERYVVAEDGGMSVQSAPPRRRRNRNGNADNPVPVAGISAASIAALARAMVDQQSIQANVSAIDKRISKLAEERRGLEMEMQRVLGRMDAFGSLLPDGMTIQAAYEGNFGWLKLAVDEAIQARNRVAEATEAMPNGDGAGASTIDRADAASRNMPPYVRRRVREIEAKMEKLASARDAYLADRVDSDHDAESAGLCEIINADIARQRAELAESENQDGS